MTTNRTRSSRGFTRLALLAALFLAALFLAALFLAAVPAVPAVPAALAQPLGGYADALSAGGLTFIENRGQWPDEVRFLARLGGADVWITDDALLYDFYQVEREAQAEPLGGPERDGPEAATRRGHVVAMRFEGARARRAAGLGRKAAYHNYFLGDDPGRWASRVPLYDEVVLEGLYDGVDLRLYDDGGLLRYDLVLAPGADLAQVRVRMGGADGLAITPDGALRMETTLGPVEQRGLVAYQEGAAGRREVVESAFVLGADGALGFAAEGADPGRALVVDPLIWASFLGSIGTDRASAVAVGADGSATVAGVTVRMTFPTTLGAYDETYNGGGDAFVARLSAGGDALVYSTFLGGGGYDIAQAVAVGADGSATVAGYTGSAGFPSTPGAYDPSHNGGFDAFVVRLSADGSALDYATFLGGVNSDIAWAVAVGADGSATVAGYTDSAGFPTTAGAYDETFGGSTDAFVARLSADGDALDYAAFLGGTSTDWAYAVAVGADGSATVAGYTAGADFPTTPGAYDPSHNGGNDAFVVRLSADGDALDYATFLGRGGDDEAYGVAVGADGSATVAGYTHGANFPSTPGAYDTGHNGVADAFVARLDVGLSEPGAVTVRPVDGMGDPVPEPVAVPAVGQTEVFYAGTIWNSDPDPLTIDGWPVITMPDASTIVRRRPTVYMIGAGDAAGFEGAFNMLASFPPGTYEFAYHTGDHGALTMFSDAFELFKDGGALKAPGAEAALDGRMAERAAAELARLGADEWVAVAPGQSVAEALAAAGSVREVAALPDESALGRAYPNPFNPTATVPFTVAEAGTVRLTVYDVLGREVARLIDGHAEAGSHTAVFDASRLPSGTYLVRFTAAGQAHTQRLTLLK